MTFQNFLFNFYQPITISAKKIYLVNNRLKKRFRNSWIWRKKKSFFCDFSANGDPSYLTGTKDEMIMVQASTANWNMTEICRCRKSPTFADRGFQLRYLTEKIKSYLSRLWLLNQVSICSRRGKRKRESRQRKFNPLTIFRVRSRICTMFRDGSRFLPIVWFAIWKCNFARTKFFSNIAEIASRPRPTSDNNFRFQILLCQFSLFSQKFSKAKKNHEIVLRLCQ